MFPTAALITAEAVGGSVVLAVLGAQLLALGRREFTAHQGFELAQWASRNAEREAKDRRFWTLTLQ